MAIEASPGTGRAPRQAEDAVPLYFLPFFLFFFRNSFRRTRSTGDMKGRKGDRAASPELRLSLLPPPPFFFFLSPCVENESAWKDSAGWCGITRARECRRSPPPPLPSFSSWSSWHSTQSGQQPPRSQASEAPLPSFFLLGDRRRALR